MAFVSGQLDTNDLSANANIQGHQIGDNTIQFRNLAANDLVKVVASGTSSIGSFTIGSTGNNAKLLSVPHGQSYAPLVDVYISAQLVNPSVGLVAVSYVPLPIFATNGGDLGSYFFQTTGGSSYALNVTYGVDSTNIYVLMTYTGSAITGSVTINPVPVAYYIRESAVSS